MSASAVTGLGSIASAMNQAIVNQKARADKVFAKIDTNNDGYISKSEFESFAQNLGMSQDKADAIYSKMDPNNTGQVSKTQFEQAFAKMRGAHGGEGHHAVKGGNDGDGDDSPSQQGSSASATGSNSLASNLVSQIEDNAGIDSSSSDDSSQSDSSSLSKEAKLSLKLKEVLSGQYTDSSGQQIVFKASISERVDIFA